MKLRLTDAEFDELKRKRSDYTSDDGDFVSSTCSRRQIDRPVPGFYRVRLARGGMWLGAVIRYEPTRDPETGEVLDRSYLWSAEINGRSCGDPSPDWISAGVHRVWEHGRLITESEYRYLLADAAWHRQNSDVDPRGPIDLLRMPLPF